MKPFDLQAALAGKPVITRDGREVAQIKHFSELEELDCVYAVVDNIVLSFAECGEFILGGEHPNDLFMASEKKEFWVNIYPDQLGGLYPSKVQADSHAGGNRIRAQRFEYEV